MDNWKLLEWMRYFEWLCAKHDLIPGSHAHYSEEYCEMRSAERSIFSGQTSGWMINKLEEFQFPTSEKAKVMMILGLPVNSVRLEHELKREATDFEMDSHKRITKFFIKHEDIEYVSNYSSELEDDEDKNKTELPETKSEDVPRKRKLPISPEPSENTKVPRNNFTANQEYRSDLSAVSRLSEDVRIEIERPESRKKEEKTTGAIVGSNEYDANSDNQQLDSYPVGLNQGESDTEFDDEEEDYGSEYYEEIYEESDLNYFQPQDLDQSNKIRHETTYQDASGRLLYDVFLRMLFNFFNTLLKEKFTENEKRVVENFQITCYQFNHCIEIEVESMSKAFHQALTMGIFSTQAGPEMILKKFFDEVKDKFLTTVVHPEFREELRTKVVSLESFTKTYRTISLNQLREVTDYLVADFAERVEN
ncbi:unnamed protein product [Caenorhabditis brenneri]